MSTQNHLLDHVDLSVLRGRRILIVEDEMLVALETKAIVGQFGGIVVGPYARVRAALEAVQTYAVDAAILDINVAGVQSFAVADALQERRIPFVFCTGYGRDILPPRFRSAAVVEKPLVPQALAAALARALAGAFQGGKT
jgi:CheY-like chemotaxis protein